jgi:hypothetical protein
MKIDIEKYYDNIIKMMFLQYFLTIISADYSDVITNYAIITDNEVIIGIAESNIRFPANCHF